LTNTHTISYVILALHQLGYPFKDIKTIRQEIENQFDLYNEQEAEQRAVRLLSQLIVNQPMERV
jgi:hypothetical protein